MAKRKGAGNAEQVQAPAKVERFDELVDDVRNDDGAVVRKIARIVEHQTVDEVKEGDVVVQEADIIETVVSEKYVHGLFTINIPKDNDPKGPKRVRVAIIGSHPDGSPFHYDASIERGVNVPNVPWCALHNLETSIETRYSPVEKADRSGVELKSEKQHAYPFSVLAGPYWERKKEGK